MTKITVPRIAPMANKLKRIHYHKYKKIRDDWALEIRSLTRDKYKNTVTVHAKRFSTAEPDIDNLYSQFKVILDALVQAGVLIDDSMKYVSDISSEWEKVRYNKDQKTEIIIKHDGKTKKNIPRNME